MTSRVVIASLAMVACSSLLAGDSTGPALAGTYAGSAPAADAGGRRFRVSLRTDGVFFWRETFTGKGNIDRKGKWTSNGSAVTFSFDAKDGGSRLKDLAYTVKGAELVPAKWDRQEWGSVGPPALMKLTRGKSIPEKPVTK